MVRRDDGPTRLDERLQRDYRRQASQQQKKTRKPPQRNKRRRGGVLFLAVGLFVFAALLVNQLYQIQVVAYAENAQKAAGQHYRMITEQPTRGNILDRNNI